MKNNIVTALITGMLSLGVTMTANAELISQLAGQAVYDTDLDITWLSDANYSMTSGYDSDGGMTWDEAQAWIASLNAANHLGFNDWRLPITDDSDSACTDDQAGNTPSVDSTGFNCTGSELGHLFYDELGGTAGSFILTSTDPDLALFTNIQSWFYSSGTEYTSDPSQSWLLLASNGFQDHSTKMISAFAWAVRDGRSEPLFADVTSTAGITHVSSISADHFTGGGAAWIDIDNDGWQDLFVPNPEAGQPNYLYHNIGGSFVEIGASASVQDSTHQAAGAVVGDYDGDGCDDIFVVNGGSNVAGASERNTLFRNNFCDSGNPLTFSDTTTTASLHNEIANSMVASFGDLDQDGDLDLYVANYTPNGVANLGFCEQNHYYRNNGNGSFTEQAASINLTDAGCALGLVMSDYDNDGDLDVYITNDFSDPTSPSYVPGTADIFYANQGTDAGGNLLPFTTPANNLADATNGMGIAVGDYENNGNLDYYATSFANNTDKQNVLNRNNGNGTFTEVSDAVGMADLPTGSVLNTIGWGVVFFDVDLDGDLDMYKANGRIMPLGFATIADMEQPNRLFENDGQTSASFTEIAGAEGVDGLVDSSLCWDTTGFSSCFDQSRGVAVADYDNDGDIDLFVVNTGQQDSTLTDPLEPQPSRLYKNDAAVRGGAWLKVQLEGSLNNRRGIGAKIRVTSTSAGGSITQVREVLAGSSHGSTDAFPAHFGFPAGSAITQLVVEWPAIGGQPPVVTALTSVPLNQIITLAETPPIAHPEFTEVSSAANIPFQAEVNGMAAGIGWIDYNNDGWQDLYVPAIGAPNRLYRNDGNGAFTNIAAAAGVELGTENSIAVSAGDYDGDGFDDLFVINDGVNTLLRNKGDETFEDVTATAGLDDSNQPAMAGAASFGDVDNDGDLDLQVGKWFVPEGTSSCPIPNFYLNNGDGTFSNETVVAGLADEGCVFDTPMTDYDGDGDLDILEVNDAIVGAFPEPKVYRNDGVDGQGIPQFTAVEIGLFDGLLTGMGIAIGDYDNDSDLDYSMPQKYDGILSTNNGGGTFTASTIADSRIGWGSAFFDADNDGYLDLYRGNTNAGFGGTGDTNNFQLNNGDGTFTEDVLQEAGLASFDAGLGIAAADYDKDGDIDVVVHGEHGHLNLFRNDSVNSNNWSKFSLAGMNPNHRAIGARVTIVTTNGADTMTQIREVGVGGGHGSSKALPLLFGLGDHDQIISVEVKWPLGCVQSLSVPIGINAEITVNEVDCDTDSDGMPDAWEILNGLNPNNSADATQHNDSDSLNNLDEYTNGTDPNESDTDGDGYSDSLEVAAGTDPLDDLSTFLDVAGDINDDGLVNTGDLVLGVRILNGSHTSSILEQARLDIAPLSGGLPIPDDTINVGDYLVLQRLVSGQISF